jgi:hypothetical protein
MFAAGDSEFLARFGFEKDASVEPRPIAVEHPFLCINGTPRPIRVATLAALRANGLLPRTLWSLLTESSGKGAFWEKDVQSFLRSLGRAEDLYPHAVELLNGPEKRLDEFNIANSNQLMWTIDYESYKNSIISVVTETEFTEGQIARVTEKTIKALAMGRPTILFGNPNSLPLLRDFGFQTFHPLVNEQYDGVASARMRFQALCSEILRIDDFLKRDARGFMGAAAEISNFNAAHARNGGFRSHYKQNVELPLWNALRAELVRDPETCQE